MPDQTPPTGQEPGAETQTPQAGAAEQKTTPPGQSAQPGDAQQSQADFARMQAELKEARQEAAKYRTDLRTAQEKLNGIETEKLSETERLQKRAEEAEATAKAAADQVKELAIRSAVYAEATKLKIVDLDAAAKLLDRSGLKVADDGTVEGADKALADLVKAKPWLVQPNQQSGASNAERSGPGPEPNPIIEHMKKARRNPFDWNPPR